MSPACSRSTSGGSGDPVESENLAIASGRLAKAGSGSNVRAKRKPSAFAISTALCV